MPRGKKGTGRARKPAQEESAVKTKRFEGTDPDLKAQFLAERGDDRNVQRAKKPEMQECACCGGKIGENNRVYQPKNMYLSGQHPVCLGCQQKYYAGMAQETSRTYALFYACIAFNVPYKPSMIEDMTANSNGVWVEYIKRLQMGYTPENKVKFETWLDGITDIKEAFGGEFPVLPITGDVLVANMSEMPDRERWNVEWGEKMPDEDCRNADDRFMMMTANRNGGMIPSSVSMYLHDAIRYMILRDHTTDSMEAKRYQEMADKLMNSDSVKNWQSNKGEVIQVDRIVQYLESKGAMTNGYLKNYDELLKILAADHGNYNMSLDIVDTIMLCNFNATRKNNGESEISTLPVALQVKDVKGELLPEISAEEKELLKGVQMKVPDREKAM